MVSQNHLVLIVDDEPINLMMLEKTLLGKFNVKTANSAGEALEVLKGEAVSLLITDQRMPEMSGTELLRESRAMYPDMICMMLTAEQDAGTFIDAIVNSGAIRVINKPWDPVQIVKTIEDALEKYEKLQKSKETIDQLKEANQILGRIVNTQK